MLHKVGGRWPLTGCTSGCAKPTVTLSHSHNLTTTLFLAGGGIVSVQESDGLRHSILMGADFQHVFFLNWTFHSLLLFCCNWYKMRNAVTAESHRQLTEKRPTVLWGVVHCTSGFCIELGVGRHLLMLFANRFCDHERMSRVKVWNWSLLKCIVTDEPAREYCHRHQLENATQMRGFTWQ